jgi:hypothetical protein
MLGGVVALGCRATESVEDSVAEYVNPKYAALIRAMREAQQQAAQTGRTVPARGFTTTPTNGK